MLTGIIARLVLAGVVLIALGGLAGSILASRTMDEETTTVTVTRTKTDAVSGSASGLPGAVDAKRAAILRAAEAKDYEGLARLADRAAFTYTFGSPVPGGPAAYWRKAEQRGEQPLEALAAVIKLPYALSRGIYVWPFAYVKRPNEITRYGRTLLNKIPPAGRAVGPQGYLGWRAGILPDGRWIYFVSGD